MARAWSAVLCRPINFHLGRKGHLQHWSLDTELGCTLKHQIPCWWWTLHMKIFIVSSRSPRAKTTNTSAFWRKLDSSRTANQDNVLYWNYVVQGKKQYIAISCFCAISGDELIHLNGKIQPVLGIQITLYRLQPYLSWIQGIKWKKTWFS